MNVYLKSGGHLNSQERVYEVYDKYLDDLTVYPLMFYMHTDSHAVERIHEDFGEEIDLSSVPLEKQERLLEVLLKPENIGCGHIRLLLQHPEEYETPRNLTEMFIRAFFYHMWNKEDPKSKLHVSNLEILDGDHKEKAVLQVLFGASMLLPCPLYCDCYDVDC
eukprot:TRINITY_DN3715_c0_g1_i3.p1 TRINITY_DN3715_c0_g1~~TRINITY_DN3715_c0_g1_i3.p1  ORF type:complete len:163 (+),score=32.84 TRINITY_DN3715_c0_g1_i3:166-654(+)